MGMATTVFPNGYGRFPRDYAKTLSPITVTLGAAGSYDLDVTDLMIGDEMGEPETLQSVFIDNSGAGIGALTLVVLGTQFSITIPAARQGWFNIPVIPGQGKFTVSGTAGGTAKLIFANVPFAPIVWQTA